MLQLRLRSFQTRVSLYMGVTRVFFIAKQSVLCDGRDMVTFFQACKSRVFLDSKTIPTFCCVITFTTY